MHCSQGGVNHAVKTYAIKFWGDYNKCQLNFLNYISHASVNKASGNFTTKVIEAILIYFLLIKM